MAKYVLAADYTLMTDYRNVPLATFFSCIPTDYWQSRLVFRILADQPKLDAQGRPIRVPYGLRKVEASLVRAFGREDVVIADPRDVDRYIDDETEVVGLHSMDPLGLGPVSMSFTMGGVLTPYTKAKFLELVKRVQRPNRKYKVVLGGPGAWHFDYRQEMQASLGIDHIVHGEVDHLVPEIFDRIVNDGAPPVMRFTNATAPTVDQIPKILGPTMHAMNEVMRGCGRGCEFCEVTLRRPRYFPFDYIGDEIAVNTKVGQSSIQLHSDDIFLYNLENWKTMEPNEDAVKDLFRFVMAQPGVSHCYPTHGTVSAAVTNPGLIRDISEIVHAAPHVRADRRVAGRGVLQHRRDDRRVALQRGLPSVAPRPPGDRPRPVAADSPPAPDESPRGRHGTNRRPIHPRNHAPLCKENGLPNPSAGEDAPSGGGPHAQLPGRVSPDPANSTSVRDPGPVLLRLRLGAFLSHDRRQSPLSQKIDDLLEIGLRQTGQIRPHVTNPLAQHRERHVSPDGPHVGLDELVCRLHTHGLTLRPASDGR